MALSASFIKTYIINIMAQIILLADTLFTIFVYTYNIKNQSNF